MIRPIWIVGFSGHRPSVDQGRTADEIAACRRSIRTALMALNERAQQVGGGIELFTGLAAGADLEAVEVAGELGIPAHIILPVTEESFATDFQGRLATEWPRVQRQLDLARDPKLPGTLRIAVGDGVRPDCYHETNLQLLQSVDAVVALWNGEDSLAPGGTAEFVQEAIRLEIPHIVIDPGSLDCAGTTIEDDWELPAEQLAAFYSWPSRDSNIEQLNDWAGTTLPNKYDVDEERHGEGPAWDAFARFNNTANQFGGYFRGSLLWSIRLHFIAAILAAATAAFSSVLHYHADRVYADTLEAPVATTAEMREAQPPIGLQPNTVRPPGSKFLYTVPKWLTAIEFLLAFAAFALMVLVSRYHAHSKWRDCRFAAELIHGMIMSSPHIDPLSPRVARHKPSWRRFAVSAGLLALRSNDGEADVITDRQKYLNGRLKDQILHFEKLQHESSWWQSTYKRIGLLASSFAWVFIAIALGLKVAASHWVETSYLGAFIAIFLPVFLPLLAGAVTAIMISTDVGRRTGSYKNMSDQLNRLANLLPGAATPGAISRIVEEAEEIMLDELVEWYAVSKEAGH